MKRTFIRNCSIVIEGHKSSISLEMGFWTEFKQMAGRENISLSRLASLIDMTRADGQNLSSAVRVYILDDMRNRARESTQRANALEKVIEAMREVGEQVIEGHARVSTVIAARGRANA